MRGKEFTPRGGCKKREKIRHTPVGQNKHQEKTGQRGSVDQTSGVSSDGGGGGCIHPDGKLF